ncbi:MAG: GNAT family N-acetyltransferase [Ruminococcaceae bacterium]|jgi:ribosomal protein S18 acetylase RimI-like enzyme|nr:GNAT family N-acetyltransferase [Oscillospiraceae bacterium]
MKPYVKNNLTQEVCRAEVRRLCESDADALVRVQERAAGTLRDASLYVMSEREDFLRIMKNGEISALFANGELCGAAGLRFPGDEEYPESAALDFIFVLPEYRKNGIGRELIRISVRRAFERFGAGCVVATVSPKNIPSLLSFMSINGFRISALRQKYGCKLRYILTCEKNSKKLYTVYERFEISDIYGISKMLAAGYEGIAVFRDERKIYIWLAK